MTTNSSRLVFPAWDGGRRLVQPTVWLGLGVVLAPTVSLFAGLAGAPIFLLSMVVMIACAWNRRPFAAVPVWLIALFSGIAVWGVISSGWSVASSVQSLRAILGFTAMAALGGLAIAVVSSFDATERRRVETALMIGTGLGLAVLLIEVVAGYPLTRALFVLTKGHPPVSGVESIVSRGGVVLMLLFWPTAIAVWRRFGGGAAIALFLGLAGVIGANGKYTATLAILAGAVVFVLVRLAPWLTLNTLRVGVVLAVLAAPLSGSLLPATEDLGQSGLVNSARHRVVIWRFALENIAVHPWRGWGMDAARALPGGEDKVVVTVPGPRGEETVAYQRMPLHPHNGALQAWLELGVPGAIALSLLVWIGFGRLLRSDFPATERAVAAALATSALMVGSASFGLWQSWWHAAIWLPTIAIIALLPRSQSGGSP